MGKGKYRLADDGTGHTSAGTPPSVIVERFVTELQVLLVLLKKCPHRGTGLQIRGPGVFEVADLRPIWDRIHLLHGNCLAVSLCGAQRTVVANVDGITKATNFVPRPGLASLYAAVRRMLPLIQVRDILPFEDYKKLQEETSDLGPILAAIRADEEAEQPPVHPPESERNGHAVKGPSANRMTEAARISRNTFLKIRRRAGITHGLRAGASRNYAFSPEEVDRMINEVGRGTYLCAEVCIAAWKQWSTQAQSKHQTTI